MTKRNIRPGQLILGVLAVLFAYEANAQFFTSDKGDLLGGFRKTSGGTFELVVNLGNVTNFLALSPGTTITMSNFTPAQLTAAFTTYGNLQWSVSSAFPGISPWAGFPSFTIWSTVARANTNIQSAPPPRDTSGNQQTARIRVTGVGSGANTISVGLGSPTNSNNNKFLVREPAGDGSALTAYIGDTSDATIGDFQGFWYNVENITPPTFTSGVQRSDLYQSCPIGTVDPITSQTTGNAYFIGYFQLNSNGTMTFTRATAGTPPPPPAFLSIQRNGTISTISFLTSSGSTYTLYYTNSAGLTKPVSTWPSSPTTLNGDGLVHSLFDTNSATDRFYSVGGQ